MKNSNKPNASQGANDTPLPDQGAGGEAGQADNNVHHLPDPLAIYDGDKINDAEIISKLTPQAKALLLTPFTFMLGEVHRDDKRRNTPDGEWNVQSATLNDWIKGDGHARGLSVHPAAKKKDGTAIVFGEGVGGARTGSAITTLSAATLDFDSGVALPDVVDAVEAMGCFAIIHTSFNCGVTEMTLKHDDVVRKLGLSYTPNIEQVRQYLQEHSKDHYEAEFIAACEIKDAKRHGKGGLQIVLTTPPLDKFRVIFPFAKPVVLADLAPTLDKAKAIWEDAITGLAVNHIGCTFDATSADANRAFYLPRHPKGGDHYTALVLGAPLRFDDIQQHSKAQYLKDRKATGNPFSAGADDAGEIEQFVSPSGASLNQWHRTYKDRFNIADVIETYAADKIRIAGGERYGTVHIECPFEHEHSTQGGEACLAWNPDTTTHGYWQVTCQHNACEGRNKLHFLQQMLADGWFDEEVLTDETFCLPSNDDDSFEMAPSGAGEKRGFYDPLFDPKLVENGWIIGEGDKLQANTKKVRVQMRQSMAEMFSFVIVDGGDARVILQPSRGEAPVLWKDTALTKAFKNRHVAYQNGEKIAQIDPAAEFMCDPVRKTYLGTQFEPDTSKANPDLYNLWTGFKVEPAEGDWSLMRDHIRNQVIAGNCSTEEEDEALFSWFMTWLADMFQHPGKKPGCAVALLGEQGTGKSKLFDHIRAAVGAAALKVSSRNQLVGNFNAHFDAKILCVAEEAFWSGDKEAAGVLKDLITDEEINITRKGVDTVTRSNNIRFAFVSNEAWVVPTDDNADARRFFVARVNNNKKEDATHFAAIDQQMENGGLEAMVYELMHWNPTDHGLTWASLRNPPMTAAKQEQASYGLSGPKGALMSIIQSGVLSGISKDGTPFTYDLSDDESTPVLREHLVGVIQGRATHGGAGKAPAAAIRDLLGESAEQGDKKKNIEFCNPRFAASEGSDGLTTKKGKWVAVPPLGGLREELAKTYK